MLCHITSTWNIVWPSTANLLNITKQWMLLYSPYRCVTNFNLLAQLQPNSKSYLNSELLYSQSTSTLATVTWLKNILRKNKPLKHVRLTSCWLEWNGHWLGNTKSHPCKIAWNGKEVNVSVELSKIVETIPALSCLNFPKILSLRWQLRV